MSYRGKSRGRKARIEARKASVVRAAVGKVVVGEKRLAYADGQRDMRHRMLRAGDVSTRQEYDRDGMVRVAQYIKRFPDVGETGPLMEIPFPQVMAPRFMNADDALRFSVHKTVRFQAKEWVLQNRTESGVAELRWFNWEPVDRGAEVNSELRRCIGELGMIKNMVSRHADMQTIEKFDRVLDTLTLRSGREL